MRLYLLVLLFCTLIISGDEYDNEYYYRYTMKYYNNPIHKVPTCFDQGTCPRENFEKLCRTSPHKRIHFLMWTRQNNFGAKCPALLEKISNPCSPEYGNYLSFEELRALTYDKHAVDATWKLLKKYGIPNCDIDVAPNGEYVQVTANASIVERIFNTKLYDYRSTATGKVFTSSNSYTIPPVLQGLIYVTTGTSTTTVSTTPPPPPPSVSSALRSPGGKRAIEEVASVENVESVQETEQIRPLGYTNPALLRAVYNVPKQDVFRDLVSHSVFATSSQSFGQDDLSRFQLRNALPFNAIYNITGPWGPTICSDNPLLCIEGNLDTQYIGSLARNTRTWFWSVPADLGFNPYLKWIADVVGDPNPPDVHIISYGNSEELSDPADVYKFNDELCKLGLRGITVIAASGDYGAAGLQCGFPYQRCGFHPMFPASCPFLTSVGATRGPENNTREIAASLDAGSLITSGGGFSRIFSRPAWQNKAVETYLDYYNEVDPETFGHDGRGYPDVSLLSAKYEIFLNNRVEYISGTSAAVPAFASLITLVNNYRTANGRPKLGFLNPLLYYYFSKQKAFNDITVGNNRCCSARENVCCPIGFNASPGWDPISGLGSLDYQNFIQFLNTI